MVALCRMPLAPRCRSLQFCRRSSRPGVPGHAKLQEVASMPEAPRDGMPRAPHRSIELSCACLPVPGCARRAVCQACPLPGRAWACETAGTCRAAAATQGLACQHFCRLRQHQACRRFVPWPATGSVAIVLSLPARGRAARHHGHAILFVAGAESTTAENV